MDFLFALPMILCLVFVFVLGLGVGSFLNVLIARLPYEKSIIWPGSRCGACLQPIRIWDNLPIVGYLLRRGRCHTCGARFSSRYLWVELATGLAFLGLFVLEVILNWHDIPGLAQARSVISMQLLPPAEAVGFFAAHACLLSLLLAAAIIDAEHRIIPPQITYPGVVIGLLFSTLLPWPWPSDPAVLAQMPPGLAWTLPEAAERIPIGLTLWPFAGPPPAWAPAGSWKLGLLNGLIGAAVGTGLIRVIKFLFEFGFGREALGLGDADLLMMVGAFLGWQVVVLGFVLGVFVAVFTAIPPKVWGVLRGRPVEGELSFGPGLATGVVLAWLGWPWLEGPARALYDPMLVILSVAIIGVGLLSAGLMLRR